MAIDDTKAPGEQETATEEGVQEQASELRERHDERAGEAPDISDPEQWRKLPKEGGGA
jgi:hypothetical protein